MSLYVYFVLNGQTRSLSLAGSLFKSFKSFDDCAKGTGGFDLIKDHNLIWVHHGSIFSSVRKITQKTFDVMLS